MCLPVGYLRHQVTVLSSNENNNYHNVNHNNNNNIKNKPFENNKKRATSTQRNIFEFKIFSRNEEWHSDKRREEEALQNNYLPETVICSVHDEVRPAASLAVYLTSCGTELTSNSLQSAPALLVIVGC